MADEMRIIDLERENLVSAAASSSSARVHRKHGAFSRTTMFLTDCLSAALLANTLPSGNIQVAGQNVYRLLCLTVPSYTVMSLVLFVTNDKKNNLSVTVYVEIYSICFFTYPHILQSEKNRERRGREQCLLWTVLGDGNGQPYGTASAGSGLKLLKWT